MFLNIYMYLHKFIMYLIYIIHQESTMYTTDAKRTLRYELLMHEVPLTHRYTDAAIANTRRNNMNKNVSKLLAVTRLTP